MLLLSKHGIVAFDKIAPHCQLLRDFVQDYLAAKDDKEHERELLAEVIVIIIVTIIFTITSTVIIVILVKVIWALDEEYQWWEGRMEEVEVAGNKHKLAR